MKSKRGTKLEEIYAISHEVERERGNMDEQNYTYIYISKLNS